MNTERKIWVIIPALNEQESLPKVINDIPKEVVEEVVVTDNGSTDKTFEAGQNAGATMLKEPRKGYGYACLKAMNYVENKIGLSEKNIIVFMDADYSDYPSDIIRIVKPILSDNIDLVIGSRALGNKEKGSMTIPQRFGNWLATRMLKWIYKVNYTDLGPFRAIKGEKLKELNMQDKTYGWTVEMQVKAAKHQFTYQEVAVDYRKRIGKSKVSGTIKGTILAGYKIITTILKNK